MKKITLLSSIAASLLFVNCSKDDSSTENSEEGNKTEETAISVATLEDGISIDGATFKTGTLTPNEQTSFSVTETEQSGFQDVGFEIELNVPDNYAGSYLQLLSEDGTPSENYYDIPGYSYSNKNLNTSSKTGFFSQREANLSAKSLVDENETTTIQVDFDNTIPAGSFCYFICIYDVDGNISAAQTLCVEVEAWGGNNALVGNWTFTKAIFTDNGETYTQNAGEEECEGDSYTQSCYDDDGNIIKEVEISECDTLFSLILNINSDGSQSYNVDNESESLNYEKFNNDCTVAYDLYTSKNTASGNWAYDEEEKKLTIVDYKYNRVETKNGEPYVDVDDYNDDETGIGFDLYVTKATSNELVLELRETETDYDFETDTYTESEYKVIYYFTK